MTLIKVCGITNIDDALACAELGADMLGFIFADKSPRQVSPDVAAEIIQTLRPGSPLAVGVFTDESDNIPNIADQCGLNLIQLHGGQTDTFAQSIGANRVIRVLRVKDESSIDSLADYPSARHYLLDTYKKGQPGGTGETFNWNLAVLAQRLANRPIILSGGLNPDNVSDAIRAVRPYAVDVSSGVEHSPGRKDIAKVKEFIDHVREADNAS